MSGSRDPDNPIAHSFEFARLDGGRAYAGTFRRDAVHSWAQKKSKDPIETRNSLKHGRRPQFNNPYAPLTGIYDMRVLELHPGPYHDAIEGTLHHCSLEFEYGHLDQTNPNSVSPTKHALHLTDLTPVWYTALSYIWGSSLLSSTIRCGYYYLAITKPLDRALRYFRQSSHSIMMWIDQICIDQSNQGEKAQQIPLMGKIYQRALNTVAWLGEAAGNSDQTFDLLKTIRINLSLVEGILTSEDLAYLTIPGPLSGNWQALCKLMERPFFTRLWVVQEAVLSEDLWAMCGTRVENANDFRIACSILHRSGLYRLVYCKDGTGQRAQSAGSKVLEQLRYDSTKVFKIRRGDWQLFEAVVATRYARASMAHDKVYGLLGLCSRERIKVDYSQSVAHLYLKITTAYMSQTISQFQNKKSAHYDPADTSNRISIFRPLVCVDHESDIPNPPSWVPDWRHPEQTIPFGYLTCAGSIYAAGSRKDPEISFDQADNGISTLTLRGKIFGQLDKLSPVSTKAEISYDTLVSADSELLEWMEIALQCFPYPGGSLFRAFWQTLVANKNGQGTQKYPNTFEEIFSLILDETTGMRPSLPDQT